MGRKRLALVVTSALMMAGPLASAGPRRRPAGVRSASTRRACSRASRPTSWITWCAARTPGDRPGPRGRGLAGVDRRPALPQRRLQPEGAARAQAGHSSSPRGREADTATTCAACRTAFRSTPSTATGRCRRSTSPRPARPSYAMIFDNHGVPIWWVHARAGTPGCSRAETSSGSTPRPAGSGSTAWTATSSAPSNRSAIRPTPTICSSCQRRPSGQLEVRRATSTRAPMAARAMPPSSNAELQQVTPSGQLVWDWKTKDHISLAETGRWWPKAIERLRHRPLELDRARRQLGDRLVQAPRRRLQDRQEHRRDRLEAGRHEPAREPHRDRGSTRVHLRRPARRPPAARRDADRVRQSHRSGSRPRAVRFRIDEPPEPRRSLQSITDPGVPPPTAVAPRGASATATG